MTAARKPNTGEKKRRRAHSSEHLCPKCDKSIVRVHRRSLDRWISRVVPVHRYRCKNCGWGGLLRA